MQHGHGVHVIGDILYVDNQSGSHNFSKLYKLDIRSIGLEANAIKKGLQ